MDIGARQSCIVPIDSQSIYRLTSLDSSEAYGITSFERGITIGTNSFILHKCYVGRSGSYSEYEQGISIYAITVLR